MSDQPDLPAIQLSVNVQQRGEGKAWVALEIATPLNFFSIAFPPNQAEAIAENLPTAIRDAVKACKRAESGLVIANNIPKE